MKIAEYKLYTIDMIPIDYVFTYTIFITKVNQ